MKFTVTKLSSIEKQIKLTHKGFILTYSTLDGYCRIYHEKILIKNLLHEYLIPKALVTEEGLKKIILNEIELYNSVMKMKK